MSDTAKLHQLIAKLSKAELHLHIEGSLQPELFFSLAVKNKVDIGYKTVEAVRAAYKFGSLDDFLNLYYKGMSVLIDKSDFAALALAYSKRVSEDGVVYSEVFFDPQGHLSRGVSLETVYTGLRAGFDEAEKHHGVRVELIFSFLRHLPVAESLDLVKNTTNADSVYARQLFAQGAFIAVGLDSSEKFFPPELFAQLYEFCRDELKVPHCVAHAGEEGTAAYIHTALNTLKVDRIDHGVACRTDAALRQMLRARQVTLTVCPYSNVDLQVFSTKAECAAAVLALLREGLRVTLNSDDPAYFGNGAYVKAQFELLAEHGEGFTAEEVKQLALNSFLGSFLPEEKKKSYCDAVERVYAEVMAA